MTTDFRQANPDQTFSEQPSPEQIVRRYYQVLNDKQPEAAAALLDEQVTRIGIMQPGDAPKVTQGKAALLARIRLMVEDNVAVDVRDFVVTGDQVTCTVQISTDTTRQEGVAPLEETAEFRLQNGKIIAYQVTLTLASVAKLRAAGL